MNEKRELCEYAVDATYSAREVPRDDWRFITLEDGLRYRSPESAVDVSTLLDALPWEPVQGWTVNVPVYSHVYHQDGKPHLLTVTLSARNADRIMGRLRRRSANSTRRAGGPVAFRQAASLVAAGFDGVSGQT